jgi:hypothetical protein
LHIVWSYCEKWYDIAPANSACPTRWLQSIGVRPVLCIPAYTALRRSPIFEREKNEWDIAHAESGLVVMTAEAFLIAAIYAFTCETANKHLHWGFSTCSFVVLFVFSYASFVQHAVECVRFRRARADVETYLQECGMIPAPAWRRADAM